MRKYFNIPTLILLAFITRLLITGADIGDAIVTIGLSALYAGWYYLESKKSPIANKELWDRLIAAEEQLKITKETVNSLRLGVNLKR